MPTGIEITADAEALKKVAELFEKMDLVTLLSVPALWMGEQIARDEREKHETNSL